MEWMFLVTARKRARVESRVLQVLDHHMASVQSFSSTRVGNEICVSLVAEMDKATAIRTADLLRKLQDVQSVDSFANTDGMSRTLAFFKVLCDQESRLPLLQIISSLGAQVVSLRPDSVAFQMVGALQDIEGLHDSLLPFGLVEAVSVGSAVVRKQRSADNALEVHAPHRTAGDVPQKQTRTAAVEMRHATVDPVAAANYVGSSRRAFSR